MPTLHTAKGSLTGKSSTVNMPRRLRSARSQAGIGKPGKAIKKALAFMPEPNNFSILKNVLAYIHRDACYSGRIYRELQVDHTSNYAFQ